jgi:mannose/fructose/N-acetylgalactosamine-specific phosphotransferase system component IID
MASRTTTSGGDYNLSDPLNSFVDVVRRVILQPTAFFAGLSRQGSVLGPLVFALICTDLLTNPAKHSCRDTGRDSKALKVPR